MMNKSQVASCAFCADALEEINRWMNTRNNSTSDRKDKILSCSSDVGEARSRIQTYVGNIKIKLITKINKDEHSWLILQYPRVNENQ